MAHVSLDLPDDLVAEARAAGIAIPLVCRSALEEALSGSNPLVQRQVAPAPRDATDDMTRYRLGFRLGERWARHVGSIDELASLASLASSRWQDVALDPDSHSLVDLLVDEGEIDRVDDHTAWLSRSAFSEGLVDAVTAAVTV